MLGAVVQARMGSTRLPGKVMADICGKPTLQRVLERVEQIEGIDQIIVATTDREEDCILLDVTADMGHNAIAYAGDMNDVLGRYYFAAKSFGLDDIVRITADCPLLDPHVSSLVVNTYLSGAYDYVTNRTPPTWPDGLDTEVFSFWTLLMTHKFAKSDYDREHCTSYMYAKPSPFHMFNVTNSTDMSAHRWTLDTANDLEYINGIYQRMGRDDFDMWDVLDVIKTYHNKPL